MVETKFIDIYAKILFFILEDFKTKIVNLSFINEEVLLALKRKGLKDVPDEFIACLNELLNLSKLYEHIKIEKPLKETELIEDIDCDNEVTNFYIEEHQELIEKIKTHCFYLCKTFKENQKLLEVLNTLKDKESHDFFKFLYIIDDMKDIFSTKFQTTSEEHMQWEKDLNQLKVEEIQLQEEEKQLNEELEKIRIVNQKELTRLENLFHQKKKELNDLKTHSEEDINNLLRMLPKTDSSTELENINMLLEKTKNMYENQIRMYQDQEISSIKKNSLLETDIKNYIDSIDLEIKKKNEEIEKLEIELKKNKITEKNLDSILKRKFQEDEEKRYLKELAIKRQEIIKREDNRNNDAAIIIQSYIRAIKQRNLFAMNQKKGSKKKENIRKE